MQLICPNIHFPLIAKSETDQQFDSWVVENWCICVKHINSNFCSRSIHHLVITNLALYLVISRCWSRLRLCKINKLKILLCFSAGNFFHFTGSNTSLSMINEDSSFHKASIQYYHSWISSGLCAWAYVNSSLSRTLGMILAALAYACTWVLHQEIYHVPTPQETKTWKICHKFADLLISDHSIHPFLCFFLLLLELDYWEQYPWCCRESFFID